MIGILGAKVKFFLPGLWVIIRVAIFYEDERRAVACLQIICFGTLLCIIFRFLERKKIICRFYVENDDETQIPFHDKSRMFFFDTGRIP